MNKEAIYGKSGVKPAGPYSPAVRAGDFVYVSGQLPINPATQQLAGPSIEEQTRQVMENIKGLLEAAGCGMQDVVKCGVHLTDLALFPHFNAVYGQYFDDPRPARTTVQSGLINNCLVEVDAIAWRPAGKPPAR